MCLVKYKAILSGKDELENNLDKQFKLRKLKRYYYAAIVLKTETAVVVGGAQEKEHVITALEELLN